MKIKIEISVGELLDKISILTIKREKIKDPQKLLDIEIELGFLEAQAKYLESKGIKKYEEFINKLKLINTRLWEIEDEIRILEKNQDFSEKFISLDTSNVTSEIEFEIKYKNKIIDTQKNKINIFEDNLDDIFNSRTFCLYEDLEKLKKLNLGKGGSLENAIVV